MERSPSKSTPWRVKILLIVSGVLILGLIAGLMAIRGKRYVVELTQEQIQTELDARFPVEKGHLLVLVLTLSEPEVVLPEGSERITFGLSANVSIGVGEKPKSLGGRGTVSTALRYNPENFSFYSTEPVIEQLEIQGIPVKYVDIVNRIAGRALCERLDRAPVYTLKENRLKELAARLVLKGVTVKNGRLVIILGI